MQLKFSKLALWLCLFLLLAIQGWLFYRPFLDGRIAGIYPLAEMYGYIFGFLGTILAYVVGFLWPLIAITAFICILQLWSTRRPIYRQGLIGLLRAHG
ncbi:MAG: hypothetical protein F6K42_32545 [Leptolyngbya sp. SIO1D8]|nr:hypothetical protein [Leptolyngbya sp. SIO1D8]